MEGGASFGPGSMETEVGYGDNDSVDCGTEMEAESTGGEGDETPAVSSTAMVLAAPREGDPGIDDPYEGMEFATEDDAWIFYNAYARRVGFNTRISVFHRSRRDASITSRQFVCAKEGFRTYRGKRDGGFEGKSRRTRPVTRVGCKAMIRVKKQDNGRWVVSKLEKEHNHALETPSQVHCLRSLRLLSDSGNKSGKRPASEFYRARVDQGGAVLAIKGEPHETSSICAGIGQRMTVGREIQDIVEYVKHMQDEDPGFFYAVQVNGDEGTGNVFWADARSRTAYRCFGDVVTFDTSYKTDGFQIPFATFTGVNHHWQPVLFGCALIVDDSETSLVWLFRTMLSAMFGRHPTSIISEQDRIVQAAVMQVFPQTRCRICKWHILKECEDKLSLVYRAHPSFQEELDKCINMTETIDEFELCWATLVTRFNLRDNEWLQSMHNCCHQWVPVYLRDTFFGEISSSQRCESRSSFFEGYVNAQTDPQMFIQLYEKALDSRYENEVKADFDTIYSLPDLKTTSPLEKQAAELYTRKIFTKFQEELMESFTYTANKTTEEGEISMYNVTKSETETEHKAYKIRFNAFETTVTCSCRMFEYSGILCRHILTVFSVTGVHTLPSHYILKRWTRNAKDEGATKISNVVVKEEVKEGSQNCSQESQQSLTWRYNSLCREAIKFAEDGATSIEIYNVAICALQEAVKKVAMAKKSAGKAWQPGAVICGTTEEGNSKQAIMVLNEKDLHQCSQYALCLQQPLNFVLLAPDSSAESASMNCLPAAAPLILNAQNDQTLCTLSDDQQLTCAAQSMKLPVSLNVQKQLFPSTISAGGFEGNGPVLVNVPMGGIPKGDPKHMVTTLQPLQGLNFVAIQQSNSYPGGNDTTMSGSSQQLVAVPMALCVPPDSNLSASCLDGTSPKTTLSSGSPSKSLHLSQPAPHLVAARLQTGSPAAAPESQATIKNPLQPPTTSMNAIQAAALAAGARIASPEDAASLMKAVQSKNVIHVKAGESPPLGLKQLVPNPLGPEPTTVRFVPVDLRSTGNVTQGCDQPVYGVYGGSATVAEAEKLDSQEFNEHVDIDHGDCSVQSNKMREMDQTTAGDDEDLADAEVRAGSNCG